MKKPIIYALGTALLSFGLMAQMPANSQNSPTLNANQNKMIPVDNADLDFVLVNKTGYDIDGMYLSPSKKDSWGPNILDDVCTDGGSVTVSFHPEASAALWDLKIEWSDGDTPVFWKGLNLTKINKLTIYYNEETEETTAKAE